MREDDLRVIASLGEWSNADKLLSKIFYEKFGTVLEKKLANFQECKTEMKECIRTNYGENMVPRTPKRVKPMAVLLEQIHQFKKICFDAEEDLDSRMDSTPSKNTDIPGTSENMENNEVDAYAFTEGNDNNGDQIIMDAEQLAQAKLERDRKIQSAMLKKPVQERAKTTNPRVLRPSGRQAKIKNIEAKATQAIKHKEDLLKEKAERTKRDREEHRQRVEQNNRLKEAEQRERDQILRAQEKRAQEFRAEQEKIASQIGKSPFRVGIAPGGPPRTTPRHPAIQLKTTPRQLVIPPKRSKNTDDEEQNRIDQERREEDLLEKERREKERLDMERFEKEQHERREKERIEKEQRERLEKERLEKKRERLEKERLEKDQRERLEKERLERDQRERLEKERLEKEQRERDQKFRAAVTYDMTPDKIYLPSSEDNYNVDDLSSHDETDNDEKPRKDVPKWAQRNYLSKKVAVLRRLVSEGRRERHFGQMQQPSLADFFKNQLKQYPLRSSSAIWTSPMSDPTPGEGRFMSYHTAGKLV